MYTTVRGDEGNFFDALCDIILQLGTSLIYICLSFMLLSIGLFFLAKFRKTNRELKAVKKRNNYVTPNEPDTKE